MMAVVSVIPGALPCGLVHRPKGISARWGSLRGGAGSSSSDLTACCSRRGDATLTPFYNGIITHLGFHARLHFRQFGEKKHFSSQTLRKSCSELHFPSARSPAVRSRDGRSGLCTRRGRYAAGGVEWVSSMRHVQFRVDWAAFQGAFPKARRGQAEGEATPKGGSGHRKRLAEFGNTHLVLWLVFRMATALCGKVPSLEWAGMGTPLACRAGVGYPPFSLIARGTACPGLGREAANQSPMR